MCEHFMSFVNNFFLLSFNEIKKIGRNMPQGLDFQLDITVKQRDENSTPAVLEMRIQFSKS